MTNKIATSAVTSADGTSIAYQTVGGGRGLIVVGGALRTGGDYLPLAQELAGTFAVHVMDRRGRGASGPQGPDYSIGQGCVRTWPLSRRLPERRPCSGTATGVSSRWRRLGD